MEAADNHGVDVEVADNRGLDVKTEVEDIQLTEVERARFHCF